MEKVDKIIKDLNLLDDGDKKDKVSTSSSSQSSIASSDPKPSRIVKVSNKNDMIDSPSIIDGVIPIDKEIYIINTNQTYLDYSSDRPTRFYLFYRGCMFLKNAITDKNTVFCKVSCELVLPLTHKVYNIFYLSLNYNLDTQDLNIFMTDGLDKDNKVSYQSAYQMSFDKLVDKQFLKVICDNLDILNFDKYEEYAREDKEKKKGR